VTTVSGLAAQLQFNCYQAVCYWLYEELHNDPPQGWAFADSNLSNTNKLMRDLAKHGKPATQANIGGLPNGTVLIFTDPQGFEKHACIINGAGQLGGYNQQSWFTPPPLGMPNQFTTHPIGSIKWRNGRPDNVSLSSGAAGRLQYIDEQTALNFAKFSF
jgi:hypothetical protein